MQPNTASRESIGIMHPIPGNPGTEQPGQWVARAGLVGVCTFWSRLRGLRLVPAKWRPLVPPTSRYPTRDLTLRGRRTPSGTMTQAVSPFVVYKEMKKNFPARSGSERFETCGHRSSLGRTFKALDLESTPGDRLSFEVTYENCRAQ